PDVKTGAVRGWLGSEPRWPVVPAGGVSGGGSGSGMEVLLASGGWAAGPGFGGVEGGGVRGDPPEEFPGMRGREPDGVVSAEEMKRIEPKSPSVAPKELGPVRLIPAAK